MKKIKQLVEKEYGVRKATRADWADWLFAHHVFVVGDFAIELAERFGAPLDQCYAAAILHDIADARMSRFDTTHEQKSLEIARELLIAAGFTDDECSTIVDDAIRLHSCHDGARPQTMVGKILATADALAHLKTDFYSYATEHLMNDRSESDRLKWIQNKIPRDYYEKIAFDEIRDEVRPTFEKLCTQFMLTDVQQP